MMHPCMSALFVFGVWWTTICGYSEYFMRARTERSSGLPLVFQGLNAVRKLTQGTKEIAVRGTIREYEKKGSFIDAWEDFFSVLPTNVKTVYNDFGTYGKKATVGDRRITLSKNPDGKPVIEITKFRSIDTKVQDNLTPDKLITYKIIYSRDL